MEQQKVLIEVSCGKRQAMKFEDWVSVGCSQGNWRSSVRKLICMMSAALGLVQPIPRRFM